MRSLEQDIEAIAKREIYADATGLAPAVIGHHLFGFDAAARAIIALLRDRLLSDEAVEAALTGWLDDDRDQAAYLMGKHRLMGSGVVDNAKRALSAALDRIETPARAIQEKADG
jgi:hypothetical protein